MDWQDFKLEDIIDIKHGFAFKGEFFSDKPTNNILLTPGNFKIGGGFKKDKFKYYNGPIQEKYILKNNDLIVTMTDLSKKGDTLGFSAKVPNDKQKKFLHNQRIGLVELLDNRFSLEFIYWLLRTSEYQKFVVGSATVGTVKHTSPSKIRSYKFKAPKDSFFRNKICKILSSYENLIECNYQKINLLEKYGKILYENCFVNFKLNDKKMDIDSKTKLPFGWEQVKVGSLLKKIKSTLKIKSSEILKDGKYPVIDQGAEFIAGYTNETNIQYYTDSPFIVFGDHTRKIKFINFSFARGADGTQILISNNERMPQTLFYYSLINIGLTNFHYARHFKFLKEKYIILPTKDISQEYGKQFNYIFEKIRNLRNQIKFLEESRDILLPRLFNGTIKLKNINIAA
ncbi:restriction endonuclease subunit S [Candidatus Pelagibacter sp.]|nr:restriction endonuclease subunit S [Candidatus Pelagibacter sp.]